MALTAIFSNSTILQDAFGEDLPDIVTSLALDKVEVKANYNVACGKTGEVNVWDATKTTVKETFKSKYNSWQVGVAYYF
jgi:hypothetical protein